jgi:hypothetical protein
MKRTFYMMLCLMAWPLLTNSIEAKGADASRNESAFVKQNLHVWAFEEYDPIKRSPDERALLIKQLGITKAGYICRNATRTAEFEAYVKAYQKHGIELVAVWTPLHTTAPLTEPQIRGMLDIVDRYRLNIQWWLTVEDDFDAMPETARLNHAINRIRPLIAQANRRGCRLVLYGHGADKWFTQYENQITILENLKQEFPSASLGIVYNFHQSHAQIDRLKTVMPRLKPHLAAVNLNGMRADGPKIITIGQGERERGMIEVIHRSGWRGPVGIIAHDRKTDAGLKLQANIDGLRSILKDIGARSGWATY